MLGDLLIGCPLVVTGAVCLFLGVFKMWVKITIEAAFIVNDELHIPSCTVVLYPMAGPAFLFGLGIFNAILGTLFLARFLLGGPNG